LRSVAECGDVIEMQVRDLFYNCAYTIQYETIGEDVNYAFVENGDELQIYFQASNSFLDWIFNFLFPKKMYGLFKVHRGFLRCYLQVRNIILDKVYNNNYKNIIVIGYSHGSAICQLAHQDLVYHFPSMNIQSYAFESPRCLKVPKKLRFYWNTMTRIVDGTDLITHLPPKLFGFDDLGKQLNILGDTKLVDKKIPKCIKYHYPQVVLDGLEKLG